MVKIKTVISIFYGTETVDVLITVLILTIIQYMYSFNYFKYIR